MIKYHVQILLKSNASCIVTTLAFSCRCVANVSMKNNVDEGRNKNDEVEKRNTVADQERVCRIPSKELNICHNYNRH